MDKQQALLAAAKAASIAAQRLVLAGKDAQVNKSETNYRLVHKVDFLDQFSDIKNREQR